ncbi:PadR family transcriptional regulator [Gorillibacterium sp. sgz5001074]|uniref:PadR family transcriptional regulator n=1 Tax=Gorillibacterium sp. sgz5001074 TaxID=3446695 RepID=UPI003F678F89
MDIQETISGLTQELRRGTLVLSVLSQLSEPQYGYSLVSSLEEKGVAIDPGTLYPLLRRLEKQGLLESRWDTNESRPRKYYLLSPDGREVYRQLGQEWSRLAASVRMLMDGGDNDGAD